MISGTDYQTLRNFLWVSNIKGCHGGFPVVYQEAASVLPKFVIPLILDMQ